jgi:hypothetical protein
MYILKYFLKDDLLQKEFYSFIELNDFILINQIRDYKLTKINH